MTIHTHLSASCNLHISPVQRMAVVYSLLTESEGRRKGHARALMKKVCRIADEQGLTIHLMCCPFHYYGGSIPIDDLQKFYESLGFSLSEESQIGKEFSRAMKRFPTCTINTLSVKRSPILRKNH